MQYICYVCFLIQFYTVVYQNINVNRFYINFIVCLTVSTTTLFLVNWEGGTGGMPYSTSSGEPHRSDCWLPSSLSKRFVNVPGCCLRSNLTSLSDHGLAPSGRRDWYPPATWRVSQQERHKANRGTRPSCV